MIRRQLWPAISVTFALMLMTGVLYPAAVTLIAQIAFPRQANGSLISRGGSVVGSALIGQTFVHPWYFHSRPSAAGSGYDATSSGASNKGPTDRKLADTLIASVVDRVVREDGVTRGKVPPDMATASASGLDPHITPANAQLQVARVARARGTDSVRIAALVARHVEGRQLGFLGEPRVNVLELNLALDRDFPHR